MISFVLSASRLTALVLLTLALLPAQYIIVKLFPAFSYAIPVRFHRLVAKIMGVRIELRGKPPAQSPVLLIANHSSYMDIVLISALLPVSFVAKSEIARWPLFGTLGRLQNTVFIDRKPTAAQEHLQAVEKALDKKQNLVIFPEGTSGDGNRLLPFKHTLFRVAACKPQDGKDLLVQPLCLSFVELNGLPVGRLERPLFCWYGDMDLIPHIWRFLGLGKMTVVAEFFPPVTLSQFQDHKALSAHCHAQIASAISQRISGRGQNPAQIAQNQAFVPLNAAASAR